MTAGCDAPTPGEGKNSWLTGTAAWSFVAISQNILGVQPDYNGLKIDPYIPKKWNDFKVIRKFSNATYNISVINPDNISKGVKSLKVDGDIIEGNVIPIFNDNKAHEIKVTMG